MQTLDVPVKQVLIEARIVIVSDTFERDLGAKLGISGFTTAGNNSLLTVSGTNVGTDSMLSSAFPPSTTTPSGFVNFPTLTNRYQVNLPAANTNGSIGVSVLSGTHLLDLELSAAQNEGKSEVDLLAAHHHGEPEAGHHHAGCGDSLSGIGFERRHDDAIQECRALAQGDAVDHSRQPGGAGSRRQRRFSRGTGDERHRRHGALDRYPSNHHPGLVNDGQTVVLGGILDTTKSFSANKVPFLADIPMLGNLFKSTIRINNKTELLIFITPKILREGSNLY